MSEHRPAWAFVSECLAEGDEFALRLARDEAALDFESALVRENERYMATILPVLWDLYQRPGECGQVQALILELAGDLYRRRVQLAEQLIARVVAAQAAKGCE